MFLNLASIFGAETKLGKAFLVAKQLQNARELILEIGKTISFSAQAGARSTVAIAEGSAQTAKVGFPQNIPLLNWICCTSRWYYICYPLCYKCRRNTYSYTCVCSSFTGIFATDSADYSKRFTGR
jgi:hypothetical protein